MDIPPESIPASPERLRQLAASKQLDVQGLEQALHIIGHRAGPEGWLCFLDRMLLTFGALLLLSGVIFFFAYNWTDLHHYAKFGIIEGAIVVAIVCASYLDLDKLSGKVALTSGAVFVGVLLAVFGQVYQTGADVYTLFLNWALLIIGFVLVGNFAPLWLILQALLNLTFFLYWDQVWSGSEFPGWQILFLFNVAVLVLWEILRRWGLKWLQARWLVETTAAAALSFVTIAMLDFIFDRSDLATLTLVEWSAPLLYGIALVLMVLVYMRRIHDLPILTMAMVSLIAVVTASLGRLLDFDEFILFLVLGIAVIVQGWLAVTWLRSIAVSWEEAR
ncbi:DUF2157 domain-containing protein [Chloroflexi bacterium TSY]|nr:DUF2157 domain-containing protein [Chloroflexi bacterium TSY]